VLAEAGGELRAEACVSSPHEHGSKEHGCKYKERSIEGKFKFKLLHKQQTRT
jgi:hypothetical protein